MAEQDDLSLCCGFVEHVRRRAPGEEERAILRAALEGSRVALARESGVAPLRAGRRLVAAGAGAAAEHGDAEALAAGEAASPADQRVRAVRRHREVDFDAVEATGCSSSTGRPVPASPASSTPSASRCTGVSRAPPGRALRSDHADDPAPTRGPAAS